MHTCPLKAFRGIRSSQAPFRNSGMMGGSDSPIPDLQAQKRLSGQLWAPMFGPDVGGRPYPRLPLITPFIVSKVRVPSRSIRIVVMAVS
jgi:hypothetical protein